MIGIRFRTLTLEVHDTDVATLAAKLEKLDRLENLPDAAVAAAGLRGHVDGHDVCLDDAAAGAIVLALRPQNPETPERIELGGELGYRLRALRRGLEAELQTQ